MIERVWERRFAAAPDGLWPALADTARFNEAMGLPRYAVSETPLADGSVRRTGSARRFGDDAPALGAEQAELDRLMPSAETTRVKGFAEPIGLRRVPPP